MKRLTEYDVTELSPNQLKECNGGLPWIVAGLIFYVAAEIIEGIDAAYKRGCFKQS